MRVPDEGPTGEAFDLVVMSEVGYYWSPEDLTRACDRIETSLSPGGVWLLVHWTPPVHDYPLRGDEVYEHALGRCDESSEGGAFEHVRSLRRDSWRLDLLRRRG